MIPLKTDIPRHGPPLVTIALIVINVAVFLWCLTLGREEELRVSLLYGVMPGWLFSGATSDLGIPRAATLFTYMWLHAGVFHLVGNMLYLWIFGPSIEQLLGRWRYLAFYLLGGVLAALAHVMVEPGSLQPMVGASGAIAAVLGAYFLLYPKSNVLVLIWLLVYVTVMRVPALFLLGMWFLFQMLSVGGREVAWMAHMGGFVVGLLLVRFFIPRRGRPQEPPPTIH